MGVHLDYDSSDVVVLDAELLDPLLIVGPGLVAHRHVLELSFLAEVNFVVTIPLPIRSVFMDTFGSIRIPRRLDLRPLGDDVSAPRLLLDQLVSGEAVLSLDDRLDVLVADAFDVRLLVHVVSSPCHADDGDAENQKYCYSPSRLDSSQFLF